MILYKLLNETCKLLIKSFYEDEWTLSYSGADMWKRVKDDLLLWGSNGCWCFTGYRSGIHIPVWVRPYMKYHIVRGQNLLATKKYLKETK